MANFLNTSATNYYLEELIKSASDRLILISPFLKINDRIKALLEDKNRLKIDERIAKDEGTLEEHESLKTDIKAVGKDNVQLQKDIAELKEKQAELIAAQEAEIKRLEAIVAKEAEEARIVREEAEAKAQEQQAAEWADAELDRLEALANGEIIVEELPEVTVEETEEGRVKLTIPVNQR